MHRQLSGILFLAALLPSTLASLAPNTSPSTPFPLPSFPNPPAAFRPKFRYWLPDASVPAAAVQADIAALASISAGGLEFLPFYNYGQQPPIATDWATYGFGTPAFTALLAAALDATARAGLVFDFALGPNQGAGVPAVPASEGLAVELVYGAREVGGGGGGGEGGLAVPAPEVHFNYEPLEGFINPPELWGGNELVAVLAARVLSRGPRTGRGVAGDLVVLDEGSVVDLTNRTRTRGAGGLSVEWTAPASGGTRNSTWVLMAFYQRYTNERSCVSVPNASTWLGNGSWMVDHFSERGAKKMTDFWDEHMFSDATIKSLISQVGGYSWEDSMEMMASLWWTPGFLDKFKQARGYSAVKYLPVFFQANNLWNSYSAPYKTTYTYDARYPDGGRFSEDYRLTLNEGYEAQLKHLQAWARSHGLDHSCQPAYNLPLDMASTIPLVGAPELESLGFSESIDLYRQFTGPAHLGGRNAISTEIGAQRVGAYIQPVPTLLALFRDSFAAGVNTLVVHGFPYGGPYLGTTWPGYTPFQYEFGEMWGPRMPAWRFLNDTMLYAGRNSLVLKTGVPRVDLAFYMWKQPWSGRPVYEGLELNTVGYTHEYLGPANLVAPQAVVREGVLAPDGPAYRALVLYNQTRITPEASATLLGFAQAGLPIFVVSAAGTNWTTIGATGQETVSTNMAKLVGGTFPSVRNLRPAEFGPDLLVSMNISPRTTVLAVEGAQNASLLYSNWRSDAANGLELVYILNRGPKATFTLSLAVADDDSTPYFLDAWTGEQAPLATYLRTEDAVVAKLSLAQQQSTILAFAKTSGSSPVHVVSRSENVDRVHTNSGGRIEALIDDSIEASILLSNGTQIDIPERSTGSPPPPSTTLGPWNLTLESYAAPSRLSTSSVSSNITTIRHPTALSTLVPWTQIPSLQDLSGIGTYRTTLTLPPSTTADAAYTLHFTGRVYDTLRAFVNGALVPALDPAAPDDGRDISALLQPGLNEVRVEVSSTLFNVVRLRIGDVRSVGAPSKAPRGYGKGGRAEFGLVGEVVVRRWKRVVVA